MDEHPKQRFKAFRQAKKRFVELVEGRFSIRAHMFLILLATILSGVVSNRLLLGIGLTAMAARYPLAVAFSYAVFFLLIKGWFEYIAQADHLARDGMAERVVVDRALDGILVPDSKGKVGKGGFRYANAASSPDSGVVVEAMTSAGDGLDGAASMVTDLGIEGIADADGCAAGCFGIMVVVLLVTAIYGAGVWLVVEAPMVLTEGLFQVLIAGSLMRRMRQMEAPNWVGGVFTLTWKPFLVAGALALAVGLYAQNECPLAVRMSDVLHCRHTLAEHERGSIVPPPPRFQLPAERPPFPNPQRLPGR